MTPAEPRWLSDWLTAPVAPDEALSRFDALPGLDPEEMLGRWRGAGLATGHVYDGVLESLGWHGKAFESHDRVHPLLFRSSAGAVALDPGRIPVGTALRWPGLLHSRLAPAGFSLLLPLMRARGPTARLRKVEFRSRSSAAMIYDRQPIIDHFRRIGDGTVLGLMDMRGVPPFFFLLARDAPRVGGPGDADAPRPASGR